MLRHFVLISHSLTWNKRFHGLVENIFECEYVINRHIEFCLCAIAYKNYMAPATSVFCFFVSILSIAYFSIHKI